MKLLVFSHSELFLQGVARLLRSAVPLDMDFANSFDSEAIQASFARARPDVVIVDSELLDGAQEIVRAILPLAPTIRVLTMSIDSNQVEVFDRRAVSLSQPDDLAKLFGFASSAPAPAAASATAPVPDG